MPDRNDFKGILATLQTPFNKDGSIDEQLFKENAYRLANSGAQGVYCLGSSAEFFSVSLEEHYRLTELFVNQIGDAALKIVGCISTSLTEMIGKARHAHDCGADAVFVTPPFVNPLNTQERLLSIRQLARACPGLGVIHYNESITRYGSLEPEDYADLAELDNFWGSKQGDPSFAWWMELQRLTPELGHMVLDNLLVPAMMLGGKGAFSAIICLSPSYALEIYKACLEQDWERALRLQQECNRFFKEVYEPLQAKGYADPAIDKALMNAFGYVPGGETRPPLLPVPRELERGIMKKVKADFAFLLS
jgi:4-hydroxy-tetrahydrodipicolinate synthase